MCNPVVSSGYEPKSLFVGWVCGFLFEEGGYFEEEAEDGFEDYFKIFWFEYVEFVVYFVEECIEPGEPDLIDFVFVGEWSFVEFFDEGLDRRELFVGDGFGDGDGEF